MNVWLKTNIIQKLNIKDNLFNRYAFTWAVFCCLYFAMNLLYIKDILAADILTIYKFHSCLAILSHSIIVCLLIGGVLYLFLKNRSGNTKSIVISVFMVLLGTLTVADIIVYNIYTFHINGFILNEITQPEFFKSSGVTESSLYLTIFEVILFMLFISLLIRMLFAEKWSTLNRFMDRINGKKIVLWIVVGIVVTEKLIMLFTSYSRPPYVYKLSRSIPVVYVNPVVHLQHVLKIKGVEDKKEVFDSLIGDYSDITYPLKSEVGQFNKKYNVLILSMESMRHSYYNKELMPKVSAFIEKYGMEKKNHFSGSNSTHLGIFSILYGINPFYHVYVKTKRALSFPLLAFNENNYETSFYTTTSVKWHRMDYYIEQNFDTMSAIEGADLGDVVNADRIMTKKVLGHIDASSKKKQLVMAHYSSSHYPFYFPEDKAIYKPYLDEPFSKKNYLLLERIKPKLLNSFYNSIAFTDDEFGKILDKLVSTGHINDTIVIITSDHGCEFGEDGHFFYSSTLKSYQTQVPLAIYIPSRKNAIRYTAPSSHMDVFPTIFDAMGYTGDMINFQGKSLLRESNPDDYAIVTYQEVFEPKKFSIIDQSYKLVVDYDQAAFITDMTDFDDKPVKDIDDKKKRIKFLFDSIHYFRGKEQQ
jgi:hypothetical protein